MCLGNPALIKQLGGKIEGEQEATDYGTNPTTGQERYPDNTYNEHSGFEYEASQQEQSSTGMKGDTLKGDSPLTDTKKNSGGGAELNY